MKNLFDKVWLVLGSFIIMIGASILIVVVRIAKWFISSKPIANREDDIFQDSRKHPLPPVLEKSNIDG